MSAPFKTWQFWGWLLLATIAVTVVTLPILAHRRAVQSSIASFTAEAELRRQQNGSASTAIPAGTRTSIDDLTIKIYKAQYSRISEELQITVGLDEIGPHAYVVDSMSSSAFLSIDGSKWLAPEIFIPDAKTTFGTSVSSSRSLVRYSRPAPREGAVLQVVWRNRNPRTNEFEEIYSAEYIY